MILILVLIYFEHKLSLTLLSLFTLFLLYIIIWFFLFLFRTCIMFYRKWIVLVNLLFFVRWGYFTIWLGLWTICLALLWWFFCQCYCLSIIVYKLFFTILYKILSKIDVFFSRLPIFIIFLWKWWLNGPFYRSCCHSRMSFHNNLFFLRNWFV